MTKQVVIFIHGIGEQQPGYSDKCRSKIDRQIIEFLEDVNKSNIIYKEVCWSAVTSKHQAELWRLLNIRQNLNWKKVRQLVVSFVGDAISYQITPHGRPVYDEIHLMVNNTVEAIENEFSADEIEFTFIAHSLGTVIISNYLHDKRKHLTATNLFTLGSPLALWALRYGDPAKANKPVQLAKEGAWVNILDDEDVLAYPLKNLNHHYNATVTYDYVTEIGGLLSVGNPLSHLGYWEDNNVIKPIAKKLALDYLRLNNDTTYDEDDYIKFIKNLWNI